MANAMSSKWIALLGLLAVAGYQNRDKIADMVGARNRAPGSAPGPIGQQDPQGGGLGGGIPGGASAGGVFSGGLRGPDRAIQGERPRTGCGLLGQDRSQSAAWLRSARASDRG